MNLKIFFKSIYLKIIKINDSPHKIAGGFALGVFLGIFPGAGPIASIVLAYFFQVNRAAALAGSLLTNAWFSVITFVLAIKLGSFLMGTHWQEIHDASKKLFDDFKIQKLFDGSSYVVLKPMLAGYAAIGFISGVIVYCIVLMVVLAYRGRKKNISSSISSKQ